MEAAREKQVSMNEAKHREWTEIAREKLSDSESKLRQVSDSERGKRACVGTIASWLVQGQTQVCG